MQLVDVIPVDKIQHSLGVVVEIESLRSSDPLEISMAHSDDLFTAGAAAWHRLVQSGRFSIDPRMMAPFFDAQDWRLILAIQDVIGCPLIRDFAHVRGTIKYRGKSVQVLESCVAHLEWGDLQLVDIFMGDPRHRLSAKQRASGTQRYRGFGLLGEVLANLSLGARERGCVAVTLTAATVELVPVFQRFGFIVEDNEIARAALKVGFGVPMEVRV